MNSVHALAAAVEPTVLILDDDPENLTMLGELLGDRYRVRAASSGPRALPLAAQALTPDLILLDVTMPPMSATEDEQPGLELGTVDHLTKPLGAAIVLARVHAHLELAGARARLRHHNASLETEVHRRTEESQAIQDLTPRAVARQAETRDNETGGPIQRTSPRVCKPALDFMQAREQLAAGRGTHFGPHLPDTLLGADAEFCGIARRHVDPP